MTSKYPAVVRFMEDELSASGPGAGCPSTQTVVSQSSPLNGEKLQSATDSTPGIFATESRRPAKSGLRCPGR